MRHWWRLGLCFEIIGAGQAALDLTVQHVKTRRQFGQPLGAFQAIQHRLSECAMLLHGARLLARHAAWTRAAEDAALAAGYCQEVAARLAYETAQFHGAIGITLEYPLHFFSYRLRVLQGELGGSGLQYGAAGSLEFAVMGSA
jgi:alkylation response protein AidB-like acyl-CoA dehydrogenase